jgi:hypothetical protein
MPYPTTFSLNHCAIVMGGLGPFEGFAEGDALTLEQPNDDFESQESSDEHIIWVQKHASKMDGMLRLGQGNPLISAVKLLHEASRKAGGILYSFSAKNLKSTDELASGVIILKKRISLKWGDTAQPAEIPFDFLPSVYVGGTLPPLVA